MKIKAIVCAVLTCLVSLNVWAGEASNRQKFDQAVANASKHVATLAKDMKVGRDDSRLTIKKQTRTFKVQSRTKDGRISKRGEYEIEGPSATGFIINVRHGNGKYNESMGRGSKPDLDRSDFNRRRDTDFFNTSALLEFDGFYVVVDIAFGEKADDRLILSIFERIETSLNEVAKLP